ncbi:MAG TPA: DUF2795 domain-containing protein [Ktedonobacterales bacterium]|jgi:uncharacterized protein DUF2795|nr:DUF2795 domain-containing protein [Ktedonobacterales bacterium]
MATSERGQSSGKRISPIQLQKHLKGVNYPASKRDLVAKAQQNNASAEIVQKIQHLPADSFNGPKDVMKALGQTE